MGDIIDGWQLKRRWYWQQRTTTWCRKSCARRARAPQVIYIPGNHDEAVRHFLDLAFGGIAIRDEAIHTTARGLRLLVTHGDLFDGVVQYARWLAYLGDRLYTFSLQLNRWLNALRARLGLRYWSLAQFLKHKVKNAVELHRRLRGGAGRRGASASASTASSAATFTRPRFATSDGILYCNDGDWVESLTALVETAEGELIHPALARRARRASRTRRRGRGPCAS